MKRTEANTREPYSRKSASSQNFLRHRLHSLGMSMIVMGICFPLYYLGLFGSVEGPLNPGKLGERLFNMGISRTHIMVFLLSLLVITIIWNWVYNLAGIMMGSNLRCKKQIDDKGTYCGAPVTRKKVAHKKTGVPIPQYVCTRGHKRPDAHFQPVKKGIVGHTLWVMLLLFCIIICLT